MNTLYPSVATTRRVWAAVTRTPQASRRELATRLNLSYGHVNDALHMLREAGYVAFERGAARAIEIVVPFYLNS